MKNRSEKTNIDLSVMIAITLFNQLLENYILKNNFETTIRIKLLFIKLILWRLEKVHGQKLKKYI